MSEESKADSASQEASSPAPVGSVKNVVVVSLAFLFLFTAFQSIATFQSSLNKDDGLGTTSLSIIYISLIVSSMFVPSYVIDKLGTKWTMVCAMFCYTFYMLAQFKPTLYTLPPAAVIIGVGAAPLWIAKCSYLAQVAGQLSETSGIATERLTVRFFGIFFLFFQCSSIIGNAFSSLVLGTGLENANVTQDQLLECGVNYCPKETDEAKANSTSDDEEAENSNFEADQTRVYILMSMFLLCSLVAPAIVAFLVDPLKKPEKKEERPPLTHLLVATIRHWQNPVQLLLIPITFWSGIEQGFFGADFSSAYVTCAYGIRNLGYVMIAFGVFDATFSYGFGTVIKWTGRMPIFCLGAAINFAVIAVLFLWPPSPEQPAIFYVLSALWGIADAVWQTQINALYGTFFVGQEEAGFSNYRLWESLGFFVAYLVHTRLCIEAKLWSLVAILAAGMAGYLAAEGKMKKS